MNINVNKTEYLMIIESLNLELTELVVGSIQNNETEKEKNSIRSLIKRLKNDFYKQLH